MDILLKYCEVVKHMDILLKYCGAATNMDILLKYFGYNDVGQITSHHNVAGQRST